MKKTVLLCLLPFICTATLGESDSDLEQDGPANFFIASIIMYDKVIRAKVLEDQLIIDALTSTYPDISITLDDMRERKANKQKAHPANIRFIEIVLDLISSHQIEELDEDTKRSLAQISEMFEKKEKALNNIL